MARINNPNKTRPQRIDPEFEKEMRELAKQRFIKGLAKGIKPPTLAEMTRLLRRTSGYPLSISDLKTKRKKEDLV